jgi:hypothetical protein
MTPPTWLDAGDAGVQHEPAGPVAAMRFRAADLRPVGKEDQGTQPL